MTVSIQQIRHIAALARLRLDPEEAERMARDMSSILEYMAVLGAVALEPEPTPDSSGRDDSMLSGGAPTGRASQPSGRGKTEPDPLASPPSAFSPEWRDGYFVVPRLPGVSGRGGEPGGSP